MLYHALLISASFHYRERRNMLKSHILFWLPGVVPRVYVAAPDWEMISKPYRLFHFLSSCFSSSRLQKATAKVIYQTPVAQNLFRKPKARSTSNGESDSEISDDEDLNRRFG
ncbi:hypothetical protein YC2023_094780 [Brassica napus]